MPILKALGQSPVVPEKPELMEYIHERVSNAQNSQIRGAALMAQTKQTLEEFKELPAEVLQSLQSQDYEYSVYGMQATHLILSQLSKSENPENSAVFLEAKQVLEDLIYSEYTTIPDSAFVQAEEVYHRYFQ